MQTLIEQMQPGRSWQEITELLYVTQSELPIPSDYPLARAVADDNGIVWQKYCQSKFRSLIDKLLSLSELQEMALRGMLERYLHNAETIGLSLENFLDKERTSASVPHARANHSRATFSNWDT